MVFEKDIFVVVMNYLDSFFGFGEMWAVQMCINYSTQRQRSQLCLVLLHSSGVVAGVASKHNFATHAVQNV